MKLKELESILQGVKPFEDPNVELEQYPTSPHLAAAMLFTIQSSFEDIQDKNVLDLGCGPAILAIGSCVLGAKNVIGIDIDENVIDLARQNCEKIEADVTFLKMDVSKMEGIEDLLSKLSLNRDEQDSNDDEEGDRDGDQVDKEDKEETEESEEEEEEELLQHIDTVVMNPPFGTRKKGIDMIFLQKAINIANSAVYSLHKTSTREHIMKKCVEWGVKGQVVAELRWDIPKMYKFHKQKSLDIQVDLIRIDTTEYHSKRKEEDKG